MDNELDPELEGANMHIEGEDEFEEDGVTPKKKIVGEEELDEEEEEDDIADEEELM
jgi:hypothetical protein